MDIKKLLLLIFVITAIILALFVLSKYYLIEDKDLGCREKEYSFNLQLQSGEKGKFYILGNACYRKIKNSSNLSFSVLEDNSIKDNIYGSRLYIWLRDKNLTIEQQIKKIADNKGAAIDCRVLKNKYTQQENLETYSLEGENCLIFGDNNDYASEVYLERGDLLVAQRQNGADGIMPYDLSSIKFQRY